jgi:hypothetical protein
MCVQTKEVAGFRLFCLRWIGHLFIIFIL